MGNLRMSRRGKIFVGFVVLSIVAGTLWRSFTASSTATENSAPEQKNIEATTETANTCAYITTATTPVLVTTTAQPTESGLVSLGKFKLTAYCPCVKCCGVWSEAHSSRVGTDYVQRTASGTIPTVSRTVGVDPDIIPFGTMLVIDGCAYIAEDCGGGIKGNSIDIFFMSHDEALKFGIQKTEVFVQNK